MFTPSRCPNRSCPEHKNPSPKFFQRYGYYRAKCRSRPVPRFLCKTCKRCFSRQTFRADYNDHKPHLNAALFKLASSGIGIRQCARTLGLTVRCTEMKLRKIGRHLRRLNLNLQGQLGPVAELHFDELESYEGQRNARPLSIPILIESYSRFIIWAESAPIRPKGSMTKKRLEAIAKAEKKHGPRRDTSRSSIKRTLARGASVSDLSRSIQIHTDEKVSYPRLVRRAFNKKMITHHKTNSKLVRATWNPLFPINNEEAIMRDLMGRLRRDSWLVSKKRRYLDIAMHVHIAFRNLIRKRFNYDQESPAQMCGFLPRRMTFHEALSWRQDWSKASIHPLSSGRKTVAEWNRRRAIAA